MHTATTHVNRFPRRRKAEQALSAELRAMIDEAAKLDGDVDFQEQRRREDNLRKRLKDKLGTGTHEGDKFVLTVSLGTPQERVDLAALEADFPELVAKYRKPCAPRNMSFEKR
jgi:hypothetical protein